MGEFSAEWNYIFLLSFGMFAVGVHAYALYGQYLPGSNSEQDADPLAALNDVHIMGGTSANVRGFAFYLLSSELVYLILTSSTSILTMSLKATGREDLAGALALPQEANPMIPILASSVFIAASQVQTLSRFEKAIRRISHRIAGIPHNRIDIQERIRQWTVLSWLSNSANKPLSQSSRYESESEIVNYASKRARQVDAAMQSAGLNAFDRDNMCRSLEKAICLHAWALDYDGEQIWNDIQSRKIAELFSAWSLKYIAIRQKLDALIEEPHVRLAAQRAEALARVRRGDSDSSEKQVVSSKTLLRENWHSIIVEVRRLEGHLCTVMALLLINKPDVNLSAYPALRDLKESVISTERNTEINTFMVSACRGTLAAFTAVSAYLGIELIVKQILRAGDTTNMAPYFINEAAPVEFVEHIGSFLIHLKNMLTLQGIPESARENAEDAISTTIQQTGEILGLASIEVLDFSAIFVVSGFIALIVRASRISEGRWHVWKAEQMPPIGDYLSIGLMCYVASVAVYMSLKFVNLIVLDSLQQGQPIFSAINFALFRSLLSDVFLVPVTAFICAFFVCAVADRLQHEPDGMLDYRTVPVVRIALLCGGYNFAQKTMSGSINTGWDVPGALLIPLLVFSLLFLYYRPLGDDEPEVKFLGHDTQGLSVDDDVGTPDVGIPVDTPLKQSKKPSAVT